MSNLFVDIKISAKKMGIGSPAADATCNPSLPSPFPNTLSREGKLPKPQGTGRPLPTPWRLCAIPQEVLTVFYKVPPITPLHTLEFCTIPQEVIPIIYKVYIVIVLVIYKIFRKVIKI